MNISSDYDGSQNSSYSDFEDAILSDNRSDSEVFISDGESEASEVDFNMSTNNISYLSKDNKIVWHKEPSNSYKGRLGAENVLRTKPGPTQFATARVTDIKSSFELFISKEIETIIIEMTNIEGRFIKNIFSSIKILKFFSGTRVFGSEWATIDTVLLQAYFGLLLLAGVYRSKGEALESLWDSVKGRPIFKATMSLKKFRNITRVLRFDNRQDREERRQRDKLAPIRILWDKWENNLRKMYNPSEFVTVDEQLVPYRGRCPFKQFIPSKPAKYGLKIWALCDASSSYAWRLQVYTGKIIIY